MGGAGARVLLAAVLACVRHAASEGGPWPPGARAANGSAGCAPLQPPVLRRVLGAAFNHRYMSLTPPPAVHSERYDREGQKAPPADDDGRGFLVPVYHREVLSGVAAWLEPWGADAADDLYGHLGPAPSSAPGPATPATTSSPAPRPTPAQRPFTLSRLPTAIPSLDEEDNLVLGSGKSRGRVRPRRWTPPGRTQEGDRPSWHCEGRVRWTDLGADYFPRYLRHVYCEPRPCWYDSFECRPRAFSVKLLKRIPGLCAPPAPKRRSSGNKSASDEPPPELWLWEERAVAFCCECAPVY